MKKIIKNTAKLFPLSFRESLSLSIVTICIFQFVLFFAPALADEAVIKYNEKQVASSDYLSIENDEDSLVSISVFKSSSSVNVINQSTVLSLNDNELRSDMEAISEVYYYEEQEMEIDNRKIAFAFEQEIRDKQSFVRVLSRSNHAFTAYNSEVAQTNDQPCITANGFNVCNHGIEDTVAANFLPFGTMIRIPELFGDRIFIVRDRMNRRYPDRVDIWMLHKSDAIQFGIRHSYIEIIEIIDLTEPYTKTERSLISKI